jgi:glycosyltransferase involved in cell wall biosynthesis
MDKPLVSLIVPGYNEAPIVEKNLARLCQQMESLKEEYRWEIIFINDGSTDGTGELAEAFAKTSDNIRVLHQKTNFGAGQAFQCGFNQCRGDYVITLDMDLSYSPDHIKPLLERIRETGAKVVVASPYMNGGRISNIPRLRRKLSIWANRFLSVAAKNNLSTLTSMVRAYDGKFLRTLNLKCMGLEINPEIIYKAMLLQAKIEEIPAHLDWGSQNTERLKRRSKISKKLLRHTITILITGFLFRPVMFFIIPGLLLLGLSIFSNLWALIHSFEYYQKFSQYSGFGTRASAAVAAAFNLAPHTFIIGGTTLLLAIQLFSLGILSLQNKKYFEEIFHLGSTIYKFNREEKGKNE